MRSRAAIVLTSLTAALHLLVANRYDVFRDELYFIVCGRHPAFGYVDQPPLVPLLSAGLYGLGGHAWLMRMPCVIAAAGLVWLVVALVRLLGGGEAAQWMGGIAAATAPMLMGIEATLNTTSFEPIAWTGVAYCVARAVLRDDRRALVWAGAIAGVAFEAKYALVAWLLCLVLGLAVSPERRVLAKRELWIGVALASAIAAPSVIWQALHHWPFLEIVRAAKEKNVHVSPGAFVFNQVLVMNPALALLWLGGAIGPFALRALRAARFLAIAFLSVFALTIATAGKDYYLAAAFPTVFAVGAVVFERVVPWAAARVGYVLVVLAISAISAPTALPLLRPESLAAFQRRTGTAPQAQEKHTVGTPLPQVFADELPWHAVEKAVAEVYRSLPAEDRGTVAILTGNYGDASAINVYGVEDQLPPAISGHNSYYLWGTQGRTRPLLRVNGDPVRWANICPGSRVVARVKTPLGVPEEQDIPLILCDHPAPDLLGDWESWKHYE